MPSDLADRILCALRERGMTAEQWLSSDMGTFRKVWSAAGLLRPPGVTLQDRVVVRERECQSISTAAQTSRH